MRRTSSRAIRLCSGDPWNLVLSVESIGTDFLCRVVGGDRHVGAVALSEWRDGRAHTTALAAQGHRETAIARHAAHQLCKAARRTVSCVAGIHFDGITRSDIEEISSQAFELAAQAALTLRDERLRAELEDPAGVARRITDRREDYAEPVRRWLEAPLPSGWPDPGPPASAAEAGAAKPVRIFAPLYLSNACTNDCVYCGFRRSSDYDRTQLTVPEAVQQAAVLCSRGIRAIDLVTGEIPTDPFVDYVSECTAAILSQTAISRVHLNLGSLSADQYARLREAGAAGYHLYQETYDPEAYFAAHREGGKREMADRLAAPWRAADAGFDYVGLGILLGLADLPTDLASLAGHASLLAEDRPELDIGFSLPRIRTMDADPTYRACRAVSDDDFVRSVLFLRAGFPDAAVTVTTREPAHIRDFLIRRGVTRVSAGVSTAPGGYAVHGAASSDSGSRAREQFHVSDDRSAAEIAAAVTEAGLPLETPWDERSHP